MPRKRKPGPRTRSGRLSQAAAAREDEIIPKFALIRRAERSMCMLATHAELVSPKTEIGREAARAVLDVGRQQDAGYALGVLLLRCELTEREHDAGIRAGHIWRRWRSMTGCPSPHARGGSIYGPHGGAERVLSAEAWGIARAEYEALCALLRPHGDLVATVVEAVCADDVMPASVETWRAGLKRALARLAREWRIGDYST